ncbi:MAG: PilN domain-containing protein [Bacillota bacterium]
MSEVNLLPVKYRAKRFKPNKKLVVVIILLLISSSTIIYLGIYSKQLKEALFETSARLAYIERQVAEKEIYSHTLYNLTEVKTAIHRKFNQRVYWGDLLAQINSIVPPNTWFTQLHINDMSIVLSGFSTDFAEIGLMLSSLRTFNEFDAVRLSQAQRNTIDDATVFSFQIICSMVNVEDLQ